MFNTVPVSLLIKRISYKDIHTVSKEWVIEIKPKNVDWFDIYFSSQEGYKTQPFLMESDSDGDPNQLGRYLNSILNNECHKSLKEVRDMTFDSISGFVVQVICKRTNIPIRADIINALSHITETNITALTTGLCDRIDFDESAESIIISHQLYEEPYHTTYSSFSSFVPASIYNHINQTISSKSIVRKLAVNIPMKGKK